MRHFFETTRGQKTFTSEWRGSLLELPDWLPRDETEKMLPQDAKVMEFHFGGVKGTLAASCKRKRLGLVYDDDELENPEEKIFYDDNLANFLLDYNPLDGYHLYIGYRLGHSWSVLTDAIGPLPKKEPEGKPMPVGPGITSDPKPPPGLRIVGVMSNSAKNAASKDFRYILSVAPLKLDVAFDPRHYFYQSTDHLVCDATEEMVAATFRAHFYVALNFGTLIAPVLEMKKV